MAQLCVSESRVESFHELDEIVAKLHQSWNNRLDFPPTKLPERYRCHELAIGLELERDSSAIHFGHSRYSVLIQMPCINFGDSKSPSSDTQHQLSMLFEDIHLVKDEEGTIDRVGGVVWLKPLDEVTNPGICDSLYFSFISLRALFI